MFKMAESNNIYPNLSPTLSNYQQFRLNKIIEIKDYFVAETKERELLSIKGFVNILLLLIILTSY